MIIKKLIVYFLITLFFLQLAVGLMFQIKYEKYIRNQKKEYNILYMRNRISYKPAILYYFQSTVLRKKDINKYSLGLIWKDTGLKSYIMIYNIDEYILECYYTKEEKLKYIEEKNYYKNKIYIQKGL
jgi:hypothetical protein